MKNHKIQNNSPNIALYIQQNMNYSHFHLMNRCNCLRKNHNKHLDKIPSTRWDHKDFVVRLFRMKTECHQECCRQ